MRVVVLGSWGIGENVLRAAIETEGVQVVGVFTRPVDPVTTDPWRNVVANLASEKGIPVFPSSGTRGVEGIELLGRLAPDIILSAAHPTILSGDFLRVPPLGALNLHGSLLPRNRGTSPVNWALIRDEPEAGLTMHFLDEGMDTGDIVYQEIVPVTDADTPATLADKIKSHAGPMVRRALQHLTKDGTVPRVKQDESRATYAPRLKGDDLLIDWNRPARAVWSFIRGVSQSTLGARARVNHEEVVITASIEDARDATSPGSIVVANEEWIWASCADRCLRIARTCITPGDIPITAGTILR